MFYVETIHGVVIDVCNNLKKAQEVAKIGSSPFRVTPARIYSIGAKGKKVYH
jgi:hypothetical protein